MYSSQLAEESGLLLPKDAPRGKRRGVTAALVALCFASGVAFSTTRSAEEPVSDDDNQKTLGPWQTITERTTNNIDERIRETLGYVQSCCMADGTPVTLPSWLSAVPDYWCVWNNGNCENEVNGECRNPYESDDDRSPAPGTFPVSTILKSNLRPALTFCGCTRAGRATVGYSGRCSYNSDNHYTQYTDLATRICNRA